jgi:hypothetical protein
MKPSIEERMNNMIAKATQHNTLFDLVVTTSEGSLGVTSSNPADNQYNLITTDFIAGVICNDNDWNTVSVYIDDPALGDQSRVADLQINIHGDIEEIYHNIPRSIRKAVMNYVDDIFDAIEQWINIEEENNND